MTIAQGKSFSCKANISHLNSMVCDKIGHIFLFNKLRNKW